MQCHSCGTEVRDGQKFCMECGASLRGVADITGEVPIVAPAAPPPRTTPHPTPIAAAAAAAARRRARRRRRRRHRPAADPSPAPCVATSAPAAASRPSTNELPRRRGHDGAGRRSTGAGARPA